MEEPTIEDLDKLRHQGLRPEVVGCFVNDNNILFLYDDEYQIWQLPQGGIESKETPSEALNREMSEELGSNFVKKCDKCIVIGRCTLVGEDHVDFPPFTKMDRTLETSKGEEIPMSGKEYFFYVVKSESKEIDVNETEFDEKVWLNHADAVKLADTIYQKGKKRITLKAIELLKQGDFI